jgi:hypothetical protein
LNGKVQAEKLAFKMYDSWKRAGGHHPELVTINPPYAIGEIITSGPESSKELLKFFLNNVHPKYA